MVREDLVITGSLDELQRVHRWAQALLALTGIPPEDQYNILLAISEAVSNAIRHGCCEDCDKHVRISLQYSGRELTVSVEDEGPGFVPERVPDPTEESNLYRPGGRGIFLLKALAKEVEFYTTKSGTTVVCKFQPR
jgi:serine/threonine-protein kinase RsbW